MARVAVDVESVRTDVSREPYIDDPDFTLYLGDALEVLSELPDESVDCAATSPPFYALRDYGTGRWEGGDPDCSHLVRELKPCPHLGDPMRHHVAAPEGYELPPKVTSILCDLCQGSGFAPAVESSTLGGGKKSSGHQREGFKGICGRCGARRVDHQIGLEATPEEWAARLVDVFREVRRVLKPAGTLWVECGDSYCNAEARKPYGDQIGKGRGEEGKDFGVHRTWPDGLKPKDLLGQPWLLAFALRADGWWLRQAIIWHKPNAMPESATDRCTTAHSYVFLLSKQARYHFDAEAIAEPAEWARWGDQTTPKYEGTATATGWMQPKTKAELYDEMKERRRGTPEYESQGLEAGRRFGNGATKPTGKNPRSVWTIPTQGYAEAHFATWPEALVERIIKAGCPEGGTILDPFMGSGTTALVARRLGRRSVGIELNPEYADMCSKRLQQLSLLAIDSPLERLG